MTIGASLDSFINVALIIDLIAHGLGIDEQLECYMAAMADQGLQRSYQQRV